MRSAHAAPAATVIRLEGAFDGPAARWIGAQLARADGGKRFEIDLSQVREFHDFAIAVLGHALTSTRARVSVRGLRQHHVVMLRYIGVEAEPQGAAPPDTA